MSPGYLALREPDRRRPLPLSESMFRATGEDIGEEDAIGEVSGDVKGEATMLLGLRGPFRLLGVCGRFLVEETLSLRVRMVPWFQRVSRG